MRRIASLFLCVFLISGCGFFQRTYLYRPSVIERATTTDEKGVVTIKVTDAVVMAYYDAATGAWTRRSQIAAGIDMGLKAESGFLAILPTIADVIGVVFPVGALVSVGNTLLGKFADMINPQNRTAAYDQALELASQARDSYFRAAKSGDIPADKLTDQGRVLWGEVDSIIAKVSDALAGRISKAAPVAGSNENVIKGAVFIGPAPVAPPPGQ